MANDVFSRNVSFGNAFSADGAAITFSNFAAGMLVQQLVWSYQQTITRLYEIGSPMVYLVAGRTQGTVKLDRVLGPSTILASFYTQFGNVCNAAGNNLMFSAQAGCGGPGQGAAGAAVPGNATMSILIANAVIQLMGGSVSAENMVINESILLMFLYLAVR